MFIHGVLTVYMVAIYGVLTVYMVVIYGVLTVYMVAIYGILTVYIYGVCGILVSRASRSTSVFGGKERLVTFARYSWALPECWQSQSDCTAANYDITSHGLPY